MISGNALPSGTLPYCANCGKELLWTDKFCSRCGHEVGKSPVPEQARPEPPVPTTRALGRNTLVYLTREGLQGVRIQPPALIYLALLVPLPLLAAAYVGLQAGTLAVYITVWMAASMLIYDELRRRGLRGLGAEPPALGSPRMSWSVPWQSIRMADWNGRTLWFTSSNPRRKLSVTFDRADAPLVEGTLNSCGVRYSWRPPRLPRRLTSFPALVLLLFVAGQAILVLAAVLPFFPGEEQMYITVLTSTRDKIAGTTFMGEFLAIFVNNVQVALGGALPFLGALTYGLASYNTGRVIQVIALTYQPNPVPPAAVLVSLYLLPHTWVEESAYPITTVAGMLALTTWRSVSPGEFARRLNWGSTKLALALGGAAAILVAAGFFEVLATYLKLAVLAVWVPLAALILLAVRSRRRSRGTQLTDRP